MARPLEQMASDAPSSTQDRRAARATARAFASAISALLVSTLVIQRSSEALEPDGTVSGTTVASGTVSLVDDDGGRSLFDLANMAPGEQSVQCIVLTYDGSLLPADVTVEAEATGDLAPYLDVVVERGTGGSFDDCTTFDADTTVFDGTLAQLVRSEPIAAGQALNQGDAFTFRFRFALQDVQAALGRSSTLDIVWEAAP